MDKKNLSIIRQSFANCVFTHKVQEVAAERSQQKAFYIKIANIVLVSIVLILLFLQTSYPNNIFLSYIAAGITIAEVIFLIIQLTFSFEEQMSEHKSSALKYMELRDYYRLLITDIMTREINNDALIARRDSLQHEYQLISDLAPQTGGADYQEAQIRLNQKGVVEGEEFTWSDDEIDHFLPESLRLNN